MPKIRISSMYDLKTSSKFGVIGVHTPTVAQLVQRYPGLLQNYKYLKVKSCSVKIACASTLPADPLQIGVTAGKISPADMMNPILYRAVSNDSWNVIVNRIYSSSTWGGESADGLDEAFSINATSAERVYYSMLASREWRKVMPQQGLSVKGLRPLVHSVLSAFGQQFDPTSVYANDAQQNLIAAVDGSGNPVNVQDKNTIFRGRSIPMPAIPTEVINISGDSPAASNVPSIPRTFVLAVITPPSQLQVFYYRMIVTWDLVLFGLRPVTDIDLPSAVSDGAYSRYVRWSLASSKELVSDAENTAVGVGCIDTLNTDPELVMES